MFFKRLQNFDPLLNAVDLTMVQGFDLLLLGPDISQVLATTWATNLFTISGRPVSYKATNYYKSTCQFSSCVGHCWTLEDFDFRKVVGKDPFSIL